MFSAAVEADVIPKDYPKGPKVTMPMQLLLDLHNSLPEGHQSRELIVSYIGAYASANKKAHWTRAIVRQADGSLVFDEGLYHVAVYRGKQETRMKASEKAFEELRSELEFLASFYETEKSLISQVAPDGEALLPMPDPGAALQRVREHDTTLKALVEHMRHGLSNNIAGGVERGLLPDINQNN